MLFFRKHPALTIIIIVGTILFMAYLFRGTIQAPTTTQQIGKSTSQQQIATFDRTQYSLDDPNSLWVITNKRRPLNPPTYTPTTTIPTIPLRLGRENPEMQVRTDVAEPLEDLVHGAQAAGLQLMLASGYRSYQLQVSVYNAEVAHYGQTVADGESARPGHSEHQTGLAVDLEPISRDCEVQACFADTSEGQWLAAHAHEYGFIIRYPKDQQGITGYVYEPWHIRYVGKELAQEIHAQGNIPLESFFGIGDAPNYE